MTVRIVEKYLEDLRAVVEETLFSQKALIAQMAQRMASLLGNGHKLLIMGNGGSASDAEHFAAELVGRFLKERPALPVIALTDNSSVMTALGNDYGFEAVFRRQVEAFAGKGDGVIAISTSGNSQNVIEGLEIAQRIGCETFALLGRDGGKIAHMVDNPLIIPSYETPHIQELHIAVIHLLCHIVEETLWAEKACS